VKDGAGLHIRVLLIEDDEEDAFLTRRLLTGEGACRFEVAWADSLSAGLSMLSEQTDAVLLDLSLPDAQGWETFTRFLAAAPGIPIVLLTGLNDAELGMRAIHEGAQDYICKSDLTETVLRRGIRHAIERKKTEEKLHSIADELRRRNDEMAEGLELARDMQQAFLPQRYPCFPADAETGDSALHFAHVYRPCMMLGGDFFSVHAVSDVMASVFVCDVMGHGVRSALVTATMRGLLEEMEPASNDPGLLLTELNRALRAITADLDSVVFSTAVALAIDLQRQEVLYAVAGHPLPARVPREGTCAWLPPDGVAVGSALGLFPGEVYPTHRCALRPGDRFILFTDGLHEAQNPDGREYGRTRVLECLSAEASLPLGGLVDALVEDVTTFAAGREFEDDVCVVGIDVRRLLN